MTRTFLEKMVFRLSVAALAVSGMGQMPIFKRYYLADIPGLGFLADFVLLHKVHYLAAAVFLFLLLSRATAGLGRWMTGQQRPGARMLVLAAVLLVLSGTGILRVLKNFPQLSLTPGEALFADTVHLAAAVCYGLVSLVMFRMASSRS